MRRWWVALVCGAGLAAAASASGSQGTSLAATLKANGVVRGSLTATLSGSTLAWHVRLTGVPRTVRIEPARLTLCAPCALTANGTAHLRPAQLTQLHDVVASTRGSTWRGTVVVSHTEPVTVVPTTTAVVTASGPAGQGWTTNATPYAARVGQRYEWQCPVGGSPADGSVWGTNPFRIDSTVCLAGVFTGDINLQSGGLLVIEIQPGMQGYAGATNNGVTTQPAGGSTASFAVIPDS